MSRLTALVAACAAVLALSGCGGDNESEQEKEAEAGRGTITCSGDALTGSAGLPAGFPELEGVTFVKKADRGPTHVVDGYSDESLKGLYHEYKDRLQEEQYTILFDELEEEDSEISYKSKDGATEGQIALRATCDNGNVSIHITARPA
jgi:uncharacterized lipoprotein